MPTLPEVVSPPLMESPEGEYDDDDDAATADDWDVKR